MDLDLGLFQRRFLAGALRSGIRTAALCLPRGNGKSTLAAHLGARALTPGDPLFVRGAESHLAAASIGQARRTTFKLLREMIEAKPDAGDYRIAESALTCHVVHRPTNTRLSVLASSGKTAQGLVRCPWLFADEPGSWEVAGGEALHDAIQTAQGKPGSTLRVIYIGTLAPALAGWWHDLVHAGSRGSTYVMALEGDRAKWEQAYEIRRCNPLMWRFAESRKVLLEERDAARADTRLKAQFLSFRLNVPTADETRVLLTVPEWERVLARPIPPREGRPVVALDLGAGRAWSAAVALWHNGRCEAIAVAPGIPDVEAQERRDRVPKGTYAALVASGALRLATGKRVPPVEALAALVRPWHPTGIVCDRARFPEVQDAGLRATPRVSRWFESSEDIRALRRMALDGNLAVEQVSRGLLTASLSAALVAHDDAGNSRLVKRACDNSARDDVAAALVLAAGLLSRTPRAARPPRLSIVGAAA